MSKIELANRLYKIMDKVAPYELMDSGSTVETMESDIVTSPYYIITELMDIIDMLTE